MGMQVGLVAVKTTVADFKAAIPVVWPDCAIDESAEHFPDQASVAAWRQEHYDHALLIDVAPWVLFDEYPPTMVCEEEALARLSERFGRTLSFVVESHGGCAFFWCYENGELKRSIINNGADDVQTEGAPLPEEHGIGLDSFYMDEIEALLWAFGLPGPVDPPADPAKVTAIAFRDSDEILAANAQRMEAEAAARAEKAARKQWWKFW